MINKAKALKPHVEEIIELAEKFNSARDIISKKQKQENKPDSLESIHQYYNDPMHKQTREELVNYVTTNLDDDETHIIRVIMYLGRGDSWDENSTYTLLEEKFHEISKNTKDIAIKHMMEKQQFPDYLSNGMKKLGI